MKKRKGTFYKKDIKERKMKKKKAIKPQKKYSINYIKKLLSDDHQP